MAVGYPDLLRILQLRPDRYDRRWVYREDRRARRYRYGGRGWHSSRRRRSRGRRRWRWLRLCGWPHRRLDDDPLDDGCGRRRGGLGARRNHRQRHRNQHKGHEATGAARGRIVSHGQDLTLFHGSPRSCGSTRAASLSRDRYCRPNAVDHGRSRIPVQHTRRLSRARFPHYAGLAYSNVQVPHCVSLTHSIQLPSTLWKAGTVYSAERRSHPTSTLLRRL